MIFMDEFEFEASDSNNYYVEVVGMKYSEEDGDFIEIKSLTISDEHGDVVDKTHDMFAEIKEEATYRDYEVECHGVDFGYYSGTLDDNEI